MERGPSGYVFTPEKRLVAVKDIHNNSISVPVTVQDTAPMTHMQPFMVEGWGMAQALSAESARQQPGSLARAAEIRESLPTESDAWLEIRDKLSKRGMSAAEVANLCFETVRAIDARQEAIDNCFTNALELFDENSKQNACMFSAQVTALGVEAEDRHAKNYQVLARELSEGDPSFDEVVKYQTEHMQELANIYGKLSHATKDASIGLETIKYYGGLKKTQVAIYNEIGNAAHFDDIELLPGAIKAKISDTAFLAYMKGKHRDDNTWKQLFVPTGNPDIDAANEKTLINERAKAQEILDKKCAEHDLYTERIKTNQPFYDMASRQVSQDFRIMTHAVSSLRQLVSESQMDTASSGEDNTDLGTIVRVAEMLNAAMEKNAGGSVLGQEQVRDVEKVMEIARGAMFRLASELAGYVDLRGVHVSFAVNAFIEQTDLDARQRIEDTRAAAREYENDTVRGADFLNNVTSYLSDVRAEMMIVKGQINDMERGLSGDDRYSSSIIISAKRLSEASGSLDSAYGRLGKDYAALIETSMKHSNEIDASLGSAYDRLGEDYVRFGQTFIAQQAFLIRHMPKQLGDDFDSSRALTDELSRANGERVGDEVGGHYVDALHSLYEHKEVLRTASKQSIAATALGAEEALRSMDESNAGLRSTSEQYSNAAAVTEANLQTSTDAAQVYLIKHGAVGLEQLADVRRTIAWFGERSSADEQLQGGAVQLSGEDIFAANAMFGVLGNEPGDESDWSQPAADTIGYIPARRQY